MKDSSKDGGAAEADKRAVGLMMTSAAAAIKDGVVAEAGERAVGSMVTSAAAASRIARSRSSGKRWRLTRRSTRLGGIGGGNRIAAAWNAISGGDGQSGGRGGLRQPGIGSNEASIHLLAAASFMV